MVYLSFVEWIRLLPSAPISVSIPSFGEIIGIVPCLPALEASNVTYISLGGCGWIGAVLIVVCFVPSPVLRTIVVMRTSSGVVMTSMVMTSPPEFGVRRGFF